MTTPEQFQAWLTGVEGRRLELKTAAGGFHFEELVKYCVALGNEGGGTILLGVSDTRPRRVLGTPAFAEPGRTEAGLFQRLRQHIPVEEYSHEGKRVLIVHVPSRLPGTAWQYKGSFWMRAGDALVPMTDEQLRRIHQETGPDFSAELCEKADLDDLDPEAVEILRRLWQRKSPDQDIASRTVERLLADAELVIDGQVTYAALILLGTHAALGRYLGQAEVVFEYRSNDAPGPAAQRRELRQGFLRTLDEVWDLIDLRNDLQHFQQGLLVLDVPTFNERAIREAMLNAVSHRDYRNAGSVFIRQYPRRIEIVSPGGFPAGITPENDQPIPEMLRPRVEPLLEQGVLERVGRGRGARLLLSRRFYRHLGKGGAYTRKRGLDRETNKQLLLKHIQDNEAAGATLADLQEVLPGLGRRAIQGLLESLRSERAIVLEGKTRAARWYPGDTGGSS